MTALLLLYLGTLVILGGGALLETWLEKRARALDSSDEDG